MQENVPLSYDYSISKLFLYAMVGFGIIGMLIGIVLAFELSFPNLNYIAGEYGVFGRLRPLHTNAVIYGFTLGGFGRVGIISVKGCLKSLITNTPF
ncbi:cbb3-type cytochrome c oxidase subunit I [Helicobacter pylori]|nr:cbb3-type cytochrome c oxidase subunit I [Helicobacter pylori]